MIRKRLGRGQAGDGELSNLYKLNEKGSNKVLQLRHFIEIINIFKKEYY